MNINKNSSLLGKYSAKEDIIFKNQNDEGTLLLLEQPKEDIQILKTIGFDHYISEVEAEAHIKNSKIVIGQLFGKPSFLGSEIKKVCNDYDLTISKVSNYKGAPFKNLHEIIQEFINVNSSDVVIPEKKDRVKVYRYKKDGVTPDTYDHDGSQKYDWKEIVVAEETTVKKSKIKTGYSNWFIMAPRESFNGNKKNTCCTLFYRDNDDSSKISENDVFTEVYSWGSNYSNIRKYNYFLKHIDWREELSDRNEPFNKDEVSHQNVSLIMWLILLTILNVVTNFISFTVMSIVSILILFCLYLSIRKPCKEYYKLWKI